jgi:hypothetical protein
MKHLHTPIKTGRVITAGYRKKNLPPHSWLFICEGQEIICHCGDRWVEVDGGVRYDLQRDEEPLAHAVGY